MYSTMRVTALQMRYTLCSHIAEIQSTDLTFSGVGWDNRPLGMNFRDRVGHKAWERASRLIKVTVRKYLLRDKGCGHHHVVQCPKLDGRFGSATLRLRGEAREVQYLTEIVAVCSRDCIYERINMIRADYMNIPESGNKYHALTILQ
jgi:hypothetical protein